MFLLGISVDQQIESDPSLTLRDKFSYDPQSGPTESFLQDLYRTVPLEADTTVVLDETAFAAAVDYVGGVTINDATFSGQEVLGILSLSADSPTGALSLQKQLLNALAAQGANLGEVPEITTLVELRPEHLYASKSLNELVAIIAPLLPVRPETTHIELY